MIRIIGYSADEEPIRDIQKFIQPKKRAKNRTIQSNMVSIEMIEVWHKYSFRGEIRYYRNRLTLISDETTEYLGESTTYADHWRPIKKLVSVVPRADRGDGVGFDGPVYDIETPKLKYKIKKPSIAQPKKEKPVNIFKTTDPVKIAIRKEASRLPELQHLLRINIVDNKFQCCYCETTLTKENYTKDHIIPIDRGGTNDLWNIKPCCEQCNWEKDNMMLRSYIQWLNNIWCEMKPGSELYMLTQRKIINANNIARALTNLPTQLF